MGGTKVAGSTPQEIGQGLACTGHLAPGYGFREGPGMAVAPGMIRYLMPLRDHPPYQLRMAHGCASHYKEGRNHTCLFKDIQDGRRKAGVRAVVKGQKQVVATAIPLTNNDWRANLVHGRWVLPLQNA